MSMFATQLRNLVELAQQADPESQEVAFFNALLDNNSVDAIVEVGSAGNFESENLELFSARSMPELYDLGVPVDPAHSYGCQSTLKVTFTSPNLCHGGVNFDPKQEDLAFDNVHLSRVQDVKAVLDKLFSVHPIMCRTREQPIIAPSVEAVTLDDDDNIIVTLRAASFEYDDVKDVVNGAVEFWLLSEAIAEH